MQKNTILTNSARDPSKNFGMANTAIYQTSTIVYPTIEAYFSARQGKSLYYPDYKTDRDIAYGTSGTPTIYALAELIAKLEGAKEAFIVPSGLNAITIALESLLSAGDHVLVTDAVYGPTRRFCEQELRRFGVEIDYYNPLIGADIEKLLKPNTKVVFGETPGTFTFEMMDIPAIASVTKKHNIALIIDCSWSTALYCDVLSLGADISLRALSKYESGNSDVILGSIACKTQETANRIYNCRFNAGVTVSAFDCNLVLRGLRSLGARLAMHYQNTLKVIEYVKTLPNFDRIFYPADPSDPGHEIWKRDFTGASGLFTFSIKNTSFEKAAKFVDSLELFTIGASWGGCESIASIVNPNAGRQINLYDSSIQYIRFSVGLEDPEDLIYDIRNASEHLS